MRLAKFVAVLAIALLLSGCDFGGTPTLDTSSEEAFKDSLTSMSADLSEADRERLTKTLMLLVFENGDGGNGGLLALAALASDPGSLVSRIGERANGMTAAELIALGDDVRAERQQKRIAALKSEIKTLEDYFSALENDIAVVKRQLGYLEVSLPQYYWREGWAGDEPVIDFHIKNNSGQSIRKIRFKALVTSSGRSVPWVDETFAFEFKGGLESLETQHLKLSPTLGIGDWNNANLKDRTDLELALEPIEAELANGGTVKYPDDFEGNFKKTELENKRAELTALLKGQP